MASSLLRRLPAELRNRIYELALYEPGGVNLRVRNDQLYATDTELALTFTCQEMRKDTIGMYFAVNDFRFMIAPTPPNLDQIKLRIALVQQWLAAMSAQASYNSGEATFISVYIHIGTISACVASAPTAFTRYYNGIVTCLRVLKMMDPKLRLAFEIGCPGTEYPERVSLQLEITPFDSMQAQAQITKAVEMEQSKLEERKRPVGEDCGDGEENLVAGAARACDRVVHHLEHWQVCLKKLVPLGWATRVEGLVADCKGSVD